MTKKELLIRKISVIVLIAIGSISALSLVFSAGFVFSSGKIFSFFAEYLPFALYLSIMTAVFSITEFFWRLIKEKKVVKYIALISAVALALLAFCIVIYSSINSVFENYSAKLEITESPSTDVPVISDADGSYKINGKSGEIQLSIYKSGVKSKSVPAAFYITAQKDGETANTFDLRKLADSGFMVFAVNCNYESGESFDSVIYDCGKVYKTFSAKAKEYGFNPSKIMLFGDGLGANIAMSLANAVANGTYTSLYDVEIMDVPAATVAISPYEFDAVAADVLNSFDDGEKNIPCVPYGAADVKTLILAGENDTASFVGAFEEKVQTVQNLEIAKLPYTSVADGVSPYERFALQKVSRGYLTREGLYKGIPSDFAKVTNSLFKGFGNTIKIFFLTLLFALPLGLLMSFGSMSKFKPLKIFIRFIVWIIRGTPLMLQLITIYYVPGILGNWAASTGSSNVIISWLAGWSVPDRFLAVLIAFVINYSCYFSEIYRGGIESMSKGQYEAGAVLGLTKTQVFFKIIIMQVIKKIVPPMSNEIITLVKDTSLARVIAVYEIIWEAQSFAKSDGLIWPIFYTAVFYLAFCGILTLLFGYIEKKLDYYRT